MTFDDGPDAANTRKVLKALKGKMVAVFFVQTHHLMKDKEDDPGQSVVSEAIKDGHLIGIHTGDLKDHTEHWKRVAEDPQDVNGDKVPDGKNALESDLIRAKARLDSLKAGPKYVRAVKGQFYDPKEKDPKKREATRKQIEDTYARQNLKHVGWNRDSRDSWGYDETKVKQFLSDGKDSDGNGEPVRFDTQGPVIVLFHDRNSKTAANIDAYLKTIETTCKANGRTPKFVTTGEEARRILNE